MAIIGGSVVNLIIEMIGIMVSLFSILLLGFGFSHDRTTVRYFFICFSSLLLYNLSILLLELMNGYQGSKWRIGMMIAGFLSFFISVLTVYFVSNYLLTLLHPPAKITRWIRLLMTAALVLATIVLLYGQYAGKIALVDENHRYYEGEWQNLGFIIVALYMFLDFLLLVFYRNQISFKQRLAFGTYLGLPLLTIFLRPLLPGAYLVAFSSSCSMLVMLIMILIEQAREYRIQEQKNEQMKVDLMLSQIQPHFLFNALYVIQEICRIDPETAYLAVGEFSQYLRHNMDSININVPIPFSKELEHTKHYVKLQQLRFGSALDVRYELACTHFQLPTLTLQPIVENAIRYGVRQRKGGRGTVIVSTAEKSDAYEICVTDNGPGFNPDEVPKDGLAHVGLKNVRERLRRVSNGDLVIESQIGEGTKVTIRVPKEERNLLTVIESAKSGSK